MLILFIQVINYNQVSNLENYFPLYKKNHPTLDLFISLQDEVEEKGATKKDKKSGKTSSLKKGCSSLLVILII